MLGEFERNEIASFWEWISDHKEYVDVQYIDKDRFYLYVALEHDILEEFIDQYQGTCEEGGCKCLLQVNGLCFDIAALEGGYGFTMKELWDSRPDGIEDLLGGSLY